MDKKQKEDFQEVFVETFNEAILPSLEIMQESLEGLSGKVDTLTNRVGALEEDVEMLVSSVDRIDRRILAFEKRQENQGDVLDNHESRIKKTEPKLAGH